MKIKNIKIVSLKRQLLRREILNKTWKNHNYTIIDAVDGFKLLDPKYRKKVGDLLDINEECLTKKWLINRSNFKTMSKRLNFILPRLGLFLSWIKCLKNAIDENLDHCLLLESDSIPKVKNIHDLELDIPDDDSLIYLGGSIPRKKSIKLNVINQYWKIHTKYLKIYGSFGILIPSKKKILEVYKVLKSVFNDGKSFDKHKDWKSGNIKLRCQAIDIFLINHFQKHGECYLKIPTIIDHPFNNISTIDDYCAGNFSKFQMHII